MMTSLQTKYVGHMTVEEMDAWMDEWLQKGHPTVQYTRGWNDALEEVLSLIDEDNEAEAELHAEIERLRR